MPTRDGVHDIHALVTLPRSLHPCARTYGSPDGDLRPLAAVRTWLGEEPLLVDRGGP